MDKQKLTLRKSWESIKYTSRHWLCYQRVAFKLGVWHPRHLLHDIDKIPMYLYVPHKEVQKRHRLNSKHHVETCETNKTKKINYLDAVIDWECARYTKPDKPLNARETLEKFYPEHSLFVEPILNRLNLY